MNERKWGMESASGAGVERRAAAATLYVVATPIGHLRDITLRALDVLAAVDLVFAEDTRVSAVLLARYAIATRPRALHAHNEARRAVEVVEALGGGSSVALITDAGTPAISDPGSRVVRAVRAAGFRVVPVPGPSALVAAVSAAGLDATRFLFVGFLPTKRGERKQLLDSLADVSAALVFYEAPHRVAATIAALALAFEGDRRLTIARELTKTFETIADLPLAGAGQWLAEDANRLRGEFVLIVDQGSPSALPATVPAEARRWIDALLADLPPARVTQIVARMTGVARDELYRYATARKQRA